MNKEQAMSCAAKCMSSFNKYATKWNIPSHLTIEMWNIIKEVYDRMDSPITTCNIDRNGWVELEYREAFSNVFYNVYVCSCKNARYNTSASFSKHVKLQKDQCININYDPDVLSISYRINDIDIIDMGETYGEFYNNLI